MAKISFSKLGLKLNTDVKTVKVGDQEIEVKQYLPVNDKLKIISNVVNETMTEENNFASPVNVDVFGSLEMIYAYTNISFTEKQKEDPAKLYDLLDSSGVLNAIIREIPDGEYVFVIDSIEKTIENVYKYKVSALGIMEAIAADYSQLNFDTTEMEKAIKNPENLTLLKNVLTKLG